MSVTRRVTSFILGSSLLIPSIVLADKPWADPSKPALGFPMPAAPTQAASLVPAASISDSDQTGPMVRTDAKQGEAPTYLDEMPAEHPNIHGFIEAPFKTAYITPRGLVVVKNGLNFQPVGGIVLPLGDYGAFKNVALVTGIWNSIAVAQGDPRVGAWNEMDFFASITTDVFEKLNLTLTYGAWNFPNSTLAKPNTEHNLDLKFSYNDSSYWGGNFGLHPYLDCWWAIGSSSTVVLGKSGSTGYFEPGIVPTYTFKQFENYPITVTAPIYVSIGPEGYWSAGGIVDGVNTDMGKGNFGVFCASINATVPLSFIPVRYGYWHADAGVSYFNIINSTLLAAGGVLSGNTSRNMWLGEIGFGVNF